MNHIEKYDVLLISVTSDGTDKERMDELLEVTTGSRNNFFTALQGNEMVEYGKETGRSTISAFLPPEERCDNQISKRLLGQTGTAKNGA